MSYREIAAACCLGVLLALVGCSRSSDGGASPAAGPAFDIIIRNGTLYDGSGTEPGKGDVGIKGDRIAAIGDLSQQTAATEIDAQGLAVGGHGATSRSEGRSSASRAARMARTA